MERHKMFSIQSNTRQFNDITNSKSNTINDDSFKPSLRTSYVRENNFKNTSRRSPSKDQNFTKKISIYDKNDRIPHIPFLIQLQQDQPQDLANKSKNTIITTRDPFSFSDQGNIHRESNFFVPKKLQQNSYNRSMKVSSVGFYSETQQVGQNAQRQNKHALNCKTIRIDKSVDKEKFNFRESLGSLSKQIKNTLKMAVHDKEQKNINLLPEEGYNSENKNISSCVRSRAGSTIEDGENTYVRYQNSSSFLLNAKIVKQKKPSNLNIKLDSLTLKSSRVQEKSSGPYEQMKRNIQKYPINRKQTERNPLGRSNVTSRMSGKQNTMKYSSVIEPLTPQLRSSRKYDSYNYQKQCQNKSLYESSLSLRADLASSYNPSKTTSGFNSTKSSFLNNSSVVQTLSRFSRDRDSLYSKERSSFGNEITLNDFHVGSVKGEGRFGKFYPAIHKKTGLLVGIKQIKKQSLKHMLDQFIQQLKIQSYIDHPNIVKLYGYFCTKQNFYILLQYMEEGSLFSFIKKSKKLQEQQASTKLKQICSAVEYLHENQILHRDIKPQNIVMTCDVCKLCDFGWAVYSSTRRKTYCGTLDYVCPEILEGDSYDSCVDIWAIGVLAYEMVVGKAPFYNISRKQTMKKIMECNFDLPKQLSEEAKEFVSKALNKNPNQRFLVSALSKLNFLN